MTCTHRPRAQEFLLVTDSRLIGLSLEGQRTLAIWVSDLTSYEVTDGPSLVVQSAGGQQDVGTLVRLDISLLRYTLDLLGVPDTTVGNPEYAEASEPDEPAPAPTADNEPRSLADQLSQLAALHQAGALSAEEFNTAKARLLGAPGPRPEPRPVGPSPAPAPPAGRSRKKVKEIERICSRDGTTWYVPLELRKARRPQRFSLGLVEFGDVMLGTGGAASQQLTREEVAWARAQAARQCPTCGSQAFSERVVRH